ncbi:putative transcription factor Homeodomain-TALE-BEL family [Dioscorea sansibarensis]
MATFFHGAPEMQSESLQTLYLMNPGYVGYADTAAPANMVLLNPSMNSINSMSNQAHQHLVGIPLQPATTTPPPAAIPSPDSNPRLHYNLWSPAPTNNSIDISFGARRNSSMPLAQQGLSLSLSPQQTVYRYAPEPDVPSPLPEITEEVRVSCGGTAATTSASVTSNCMPSLQNVLMGSKFLKVAQQLLDEVVSVGKGFVKDDIGGAMVKGGGSKSSMKAHRESEDNCEGGASTKRGSDLTTAERQELQMKKAKLVSMLDEVEQRYRQYHHQVQVVVSSFEAVARPGSAKTYTALALQTISKQFRCLRDAISGQIRATSKNLGEDECLVGSKSESGSRLRFVDHHLRQQRALQQLGMIQHNAWRPQRGLPERSVSVLRAWLFEHFLHPYPKDSDKIMLAKQTGLTRSQVSNWFINARVRLWKPMVEEMYLEETKEQEHNNGEEKASKSEGNENSAATNQENNINSPTRTDQTESIKSNGPSISASVANQAVYNENETMMHQPKLKKARTDELAISGDHNHNGYSLIATGTVNHISGFDAYQVGDYTPRFSGNGVALTLGLPHCDNISLSGGAQQAYHLSSESINPSSEFCSLNNNNNNNSNQTVVHASNAYENMNMQSRKRFAAQLLPDFVA